MRIRLALAVFFLLPFLATAQEDSLETYIIEKFQNLSASQRIEDIQADLQNKIWIASSNGVFLIPVFEGSALNKRSGHAVAVEEDGYGKVVPAFLNGKISHLNEQFVSDLSEGRGPLMVNGMTRKGSILWVATSDGLFVVSLDQLKVIRKYKSSNSKLPTDAINVVFADPNGIVWAGTDQGIVRISEKNWKVYEKSSKFTAITYTDEGVWLAGDKELWLVDKWNRWYPAGVDRNLGKGTVQCLAADSKGRIYVGSEKLVQFNPYTNKIKTFTDEEGFVNTNFLSLEVDKKDNLWVGTSNQGLFRIQFTKETSNKLSALAFLTKELDCYGDEDATVLVKAKGGNPPYLYQWDQEGINGANPKNLKVGTYVVTVYDANDQQVELSVEVSQPSMLEGEVVSTERISDKGMKDGKAEVSGKGGIGPYAYIWPDGETAAMARRLAMGVYTVTLIDQRGCRATVDVEIKKEAAIPDLVADQLEVGQTLQVNQLYFEADSSVITDVSVPVLEEVYEFLTENPTIKIEIGGHTNNIPPDEYCFQLSSARARNVAEFLYQKGILPEQVSFHGYGKTQPIASNQTEGGRKRNQRVEIKIVDLGER